jgi:hypothetical protein
MASKTLCSLLNEARAAFLAGPTADVPLAVAAIGNEAGDLDSVVSAIGYAEWQAEASAGSGVLFVPVAPFDSRDFALRRDVSALFSHIGAPFDRDGAPACLLHADEVGAAASRWRAAANATRGGGLGLALTDHNRATRATRELIGERVVAIVDHHQDERCHLARPATSGAAGAHDDALAMLPPLREIDPAAGSTCSLLVELMGDECALAAPARPPRCRASPPAAVPRLPLTTRLLPSHRLRHVQAPPHPF